MYFLLHGIVAIVSAEEELIAALHPGMKAYIVMADIAMTYMVMAYIVMATEMLTFLTWCLFLDITLFA